MRRWGLLVMLGLALGGCGGTPKQAPKPPTELELLQRSAEFAFSRGQYEQAAKLYEATLDQALIADRPEPIIDARFNLALSWTYLGRYPEALELAMLAEAERIRRKLGPDPELRLLRATIQYRAGDGAAAITVLEPLLAGPGLSPTTAAKVNFLAGLIAADRADAPALRRHLGALPAGDARSEQADRFELDGRLAALDGDSGEALRRLDEAVLLRSLDDDYRGMVRVLVTAATVAERAGRDESAGAYWLRAGRSGARREEPDAREWLERARLLGRRTGDAALVLEADAMLRELGEKAAQQPGWTETSNAGR